MIPSPFAAAENAISLLKPDGYLGVVDFYTSPYKSAPEHPSLEDGIRRTSWGLSSFWTWVIDLDPPNPSDPLIPRFFGRSWFAFDGIHLSPDRRMYLEHITSPIFSRSYRNLWFGLPFVRIPYYIHLGQPRIQSTGSVESPIAVLEEKRGRTSPPADVDTSSARHKKKRAGSASSVKSTDSSKSLERVAGGI